MPNPPTSQTVDKPEAKVNSTDSQDISKGKREKKNVLDIIQGNKVWQVGITFFTIWALHSLSIVLKYHLDHSVYPEYTRNVPIGILVAFLITPLFEGYKTLFNYLFHDYFARILNPAKYSNEEEKEKRTQKIIKYARGLLYYSCTSIFAFFAFRNNKFWPTYIGGDNCCQDIYDQAPHVYEIEYGHNFYIFQLGYHMWSFMDHFWRKKGEATYWEMIFHHALTVFLISYSYLLGQQGVGIIVLFIHDFSDIFVDADRLYNDIVFRKEWVINILHGLFIVVWCYFRIGFFSLCPIQSAFYHFMDNGIYYDKTINLQPGMAFLSFMLFGLFCMHIYWVKVLLIIMYYQLFKKDRDPNFYDNNNKVTEKKAQ